MNKFLALSVAFLGLTLANAAYMSRPADRVSSMDEQVAAPKAEPKPFELAPVYVEGSAPKAAKPVAKKRGCMQYPMYAGGTQTVKICS